MDVLLTFLKSLPWKKFSPLITIVIVINVFASFMFIEKSLSNRFIYSVFIADFILIVLLIVFKQLYKKNEKRNNAKSETVFQKDVNAENGEFGVIKRDSKIKRDVKMTFKGKVDAKNSKFGNIE